LYLSYRTNEDNLHNAGWCYANGQGVVEDAKKAVEHYQLAAAQDHADAQFALGTLQACA
jgi:TPR repeat protein